MGVWVFFFFGGGRGVDGSSTYLRQTFERGEKLQWNKENNLADQTAFDLTFLIKSPRGPHRMARAAETSCFSL